MLNHEESECFLCKMRKKAETAAKKKNKGIFGKIKHFFNKKSKNETHMRLNTFQGNTQKVTNDLWKHKIKIKYNEITKIVQNPKNYVTACIYKSSEAIEVKNKQLILCLLHELNEIQIYQPEKNKFFDITKPQITNIKNKAVVINPNEYKQELELCLVEKINIFDIKTVKKKPKMRNIVIIEYIKNTEAESQGNKRKEYSLVLDLMSENESKRFIDTIKQYNEEYYKNK